jgi:predicted nucleic acid-binding protein
MQYLLDTSIVSDLMGSHPKVQDRLQALSSTDGVAISTVVRGELLYGIRRLPDGQRRDRLFQQVAPYLSEVRAEPITMEVADRYADLKITRERAGLSLDENDLWIAATALAAGATLVTRDSDFDGIDGLNIENWAS